MHVDLLNIGMVSLAQARQQGCQARSSYSYGRCKVSTVSTSRADI